MPGDGPWFDHEKLEVYKEALAFVGWLAEVSRARRNSVR
jgi:hypothetical protein